MYINDKFVSNIYQTMPKLYYYAATCYIIMLGNTVLYDFKHFSLFRIEGLIQCNHAFCIYLQANSLTFPLNNTDKVLGFGGSFSTMLRIFQKKVLSRN